MSVNFCSVKKSSISTVGVKVPEMLDNAALTFAVPYEKYLFPCNM